MIESLFFREYNPKNYHCVHFVIESAQLIYNLDYTPCFIGLTSSLSEILRTSRNTVHRNKAIKQPIDGCVVLMTKYDNSSHVGLYYKNRVFHLDEDGAQRITLEQASQYFKRLRFYEPNLSN